MEEEGQRGRVKGNNQKRKRGKGKVGNEKQKKK